MEPVNRDPFVSVVMPNWNGKDDTLECLDSLRKLNYPHHRLEIIVVDNGSQDGSAGAIRLRYEQMKSDDFSSLRLIELDRNMGAPAAINRGIESAHPDYDYILKLDNDVVLDRECLAHMTHIAEGDEQVGIVGGKVLYYSDPHTIWLTGGKLNLWLMRIEDRNKGKRAHAGGDEKVESLDDLPGCALLIGKRLLDRIGLFDEDYFVYADDTDYCLRSRNAGFKNIYNPRARIWHKVSQATKRVSGASIYYMARNRILLVRKHANFWQYLFFNIYSWCYDYARFILCHLVRERRLLKPFLRGIQAGYSTTTRRSHANVRRP